MEYAYSQQPAESSSFTMTKVFGWMFLAILITAAVSIGLPYGLLVVGAGDAYYGILIAGLIAVIILSFVGSFVIAKTKSKPLAITVFCLFAVAMGIWISPLVVLYDLQTLGLSLLVTSGVFGLMALYGAVTKRDLSKFGSFLMMLLLGVIFVSIINIFIANSTLDWILSYVTLAIYIGFIAFDIQKVKRIAETNQGTTNIALLMALNLYIDFVYVFIRIVNLIGNSKK